MSALFFPAVNLVLAVTVLYFLCAAAVKFYDAKASQANLLHALAVQIVLAIVALFSLVSNIILYIRR